METELAELNEKFKLDTVKLTSQSDEKFRILNQSIRELNFARQEAEKKMAKM